MVENWQRDSRPSLVDRDLECKVEVAQSDHKMLMGGARAMTEVEWQYHQWVAAENELLPFLQVCVSSGAGRWLLLLE